MGERWMMFFPADYAAPCFSAMLLAILVEADVGAFEATYSSDSFYGCTNLCLIRFLPF